MLHLDLTPEEEGILSELLDAAIEELRGEIRDTDNRDYRNMLKARESVLKKLMAELKAPEPAPPTA